MKRRVLLLAIALLALASPFIGIPGWTPSLATVAALFALGLIGLNLIFGVTGMLALGQAAFMALPAYVSGIVVRIFDMPIAVGIVCGVAIAVLVAVLLSLIFVRLPGIYFAIGTLGFAFVLEGLTRAFPSVTGGASGLVFSGSTQLTSQQWYWLACAALIVGLLIYSLLVRGSWKRTLQLVRQDELAAQTMGINVNREKLKVFVVGSCYSATAGTLMAYYVGVIVPETGWREPIARITGDVDYRRKRHFLRSSCRCVDRAVALFDIGSGRSLRTVCLWPRFFACDPICAARHRRSDRRPIAQRSLSGCSEGSRC